MPGDFHPRCCDCLSDAVAVAVVRECCPDLMRIWFCEPCWAAAGTRREVAARLTESARAVLVNGGHGHG